MIFRESKVLLNRQVLKEIQILPKNITRKFQEWVKLVELIGISEARKISGYHDEPLNGLRKGQRSVRLNRAYRVIYIETKEDKVEIISVIEVNKHEY